MMNTSHIPRTRRRLAFATTATGIVLACGGLTIVALVNTAQAATTDVDLGTAKSFAVLAGSGITNTGPTTLVGDIGTFPTTSITGDADITLSGTNHGGDAVTQGAKDDLVTAYNTAAGALPPTAVTADLGGSTLVPGIYRAADALGLTGALTLNAQGDPNAVFIFQAGSTLTTASNSSVVLLNGAQACNVYWQLGSSATIGTGTTFRGNILAYTSITANTDATFEGRLLAANGAVTLHANTVTRPGCTVSTPTPPTTTSPTVPATTPTHASTGSAGTGGANGSGGAGTSGGPVTPSGSSTGGSINAAAGNTSSALPDTGGPSRYLIPAGLTAILAGAIIIGLGGRQLRGSRRH